MIISINKLSENHFYKICSKIDELYDNIISQKTSNSNGRPKKYSDLQILKSKLYMVMNNIYCLRKLEWKLSNDSVSASIIGFNDIPDHSTFAIRFEKLEETKFDQIYKVAISALNPNTRICSIDSTALRSSKYNSEAKKGTFTRLGKYKGYKLHLISSN